MSFRVRALLACVLSLSLWTVDAARAQAPASWIDAYRDVATQLMKAARADDFAWQRLAELTDTYGHRLSGSENLNRAIAWAADAMKQDGLTNVRVEKVMVPRWVRGSESGEIVDPPRHPITLLGLGGTISTPPGGLPMTSSDWTMANVARLMISRRAPQWPPSVIMNCSTVSR